uniref:(northern house mosquito) hypothetical protein n=1 Tax=Culex pipiens TaxID=7175 RepID=A0A8D8FRE5_CULPI
MTTAMRFGWNQLRIPTTMKELAGRKLGRSQDRTALGSIDARVVRMFLPRFGYSSSTSLSNIRKRPSNAVCAIRPSSTRRCSAVTCLGTQPERDVSAMFAKPDSSRTPG